MLWWSLWLVMWVAKWRTDYDRQVKVLRKPFLMGPQTATLNKFYTNRAAKFKFHGGIGSSSSPSEPEPEPTTSINSMAQDIHRYIHMTSFKGFQSLVTSRWRDGICSLRESLSRSWSELPFNEEGQTIPLQINLIYHEGAAVLLSFSCMKNGLEKVLDNQVFVWQCITNNIDALASRQASM